MFSFEKFDERFDGCVNSNLKKINKTLMLTLNYTPKSIFQSGDFGIFEDEGGIMRLAKINKKGESVGLKVFQGIVLTYKVFNCHGASIKFFKFFNGEKTGWFVLGQDMNKYKMCLNNSLDGVVSYVSDLYEFEGHIYFFQKFEDGRVQVFNTAFFPPVNQKSNGNPAMIHTINFDSNFRPDSYGPGAKEYDLGSVEIESLIFKKGKGVSFQIKKKDGSNVYFPLKDGIMFYTK